MSKKSLIVVIVCLLALIAAMALNPSEAKHRAAIRAAVAERSPVAGMLGLGALRAMTVEYHSYGIVSYTTFDDYVISSGALGVVHVHKETPPDS